MYVDIYTTQHRTTFIAVPAGASPPPAAKARFKRIELRSGQPRICLNPDEVMSAIERDGLAVIH